jgi:hypothetical protein
MNIKIEYQEDSILAQLGNCCEQTCCVNDSVCCNVQLTATDVTPPPIDVIWTDATSFIINGTVVIENKGPAGGPSAELLVNGGTLSPPLIVAPGECMSRTFQDLNSIALAPSGGTLGTTSDVKISFSLNYKF